MGPALAGNPDRLSPIEAASRTLFKRFITYPLSRMPHAERRAAPDSEHNPRFVSTTHQIGLYSVDMVKNLLKSCLESGFGALLVEPTPHEPEQSLRHENHHCDKDEPERDQVVFGQEAR